MKIKTHHKIGAYIAGPAVANHAIDMAREHIFLAAHEFVSHAGWLIYSLVGCAVLAPAITIYAVRRWRGQARIEE